MRLILLITLILSATLCRAQTRHGHVQGEVFDTEYDEPLPFANVALMMGDEVKAVTSTDLDGKFALRPIPPGTYDLVVRNIGMPDVKITGLVVNADRITFVPRIEMKYDAPGPCICPPTVPIIAHPNPSIQKIGKIQVSQLPTRKSPMKMVASLSPEMKMDETETQFSYRGSSHLNNGFFVDGVKLRNGDLNGIPQSAINTVTVYSGSIPAKYGDFTGTVVEVEIKSYMQLYRESQNPNGSYYFGIYW